MVRRYSASYEGVACRVGCDEFDGREYSQPGKGRVLTPSLLRLSRTCRRSSLLCIAFSSTVTNPDLDARLLARCTCPPQECQVVAPLQLYFSWTSAVLKWQPWRFVTTFCYFGKVSLDLCFHLFFV